MNEMGLKSVQLSPKIIFKFQKKNLLTPFSSLKKKKKSQSA